MSQPVSHRQPLSRTRLAGYFAAVAALFAVLLLPLMPAEYFYHREAIYGYGGSLRPATHWRLGLLLPIVGLSAFALTWVWAGRAGRVYFSTARGLLCALLAFLYSAVFVTLLGFWLSDETLPFFRLAVVGALFLPYLWLIPAIGAITGGFLARGITPAPKALGARLRRSALPLLLTVAPLAAILIATGFFRAEQP